MKHRKPTGDECDKRARVVAYTDYNGREHMGYACWYPQMGGYVAKCVVVFQEPTPESGACFDAYVWHDGEFPFGRDTDDNPREIHHCSASQFVEFGQAVSDMQARHAPPAKAKV